MEVREGLDDELVLPLEPTPVERTLALIKPEAMKYADEIREKIKEEGFDVIQTRMVQLTPEQASQFYWEKYGELNFPFLVTHMASGPVMALCLSKPNAINDWKDLLGPPNMSECQRFFPDTLRARYGDATDDMWNGLHASENSEKAEKEIHFFFPQMIVEPLLPEEGASDFLAQSVNPTLLEGLIQVCKEKPTDPVTWLADWLITNNPNKPISTPAPELKKQPPLNSS